MQNALSLCSCVCGAFNFLWGAPTSETNMKKNERKKKVKGNYTKILQDHFNLVASAMKQGIQVSEV